MGDEALERGVRALARRDLTAAELDRRLQRAGVCKAERAEAAAKLMRAGYLDDGRFAERRAELLAERGLGDAAIRFDLERRGVERYLVERALSCLESEADRAKRLAARLGGGGRAARALARKGFGAESLEVVAPDGRAELGYKGTT